MNLILFTAPPSLCCGLIIIRGELILTPEFIEISQVDKVGQAICRHAVQSADVMLNLQMSYLNLQMSYLNLQMSYLNLQMSYLNLQMSYLNLQMSYLNLQMSYLNLQMSWARFTNKVESIIMSLNFSSSQFARISLAEFVSKLILI